MSKTSEEIEILQGDSREERLRNFIAWFPEEDKIKWDAHYYVDEDGDHSMTFEEYQSHRLDMIETDGFDVQDYSKVGDIGVLLRVHNPPEKPACEKIVAELQECSGRAIAHYNKEHKTHYRDVHVLKANSEALCPYRYYITFQALDPEDKQTVFQARVNICFPDFERVVELVRIKPTKLNPVFLPKLALRGGQSSGLVSTSASSSAT
ncbi:hypothetical protein DCAR_0832549 [Daucus carota subsp. sativus]|uniref:Uncharacterized protein n=1 Tax=Daucus carota subsp. sativus TaxID=79200 RepID=A0A175YRR0_DAUCS|nr:PREDICTED: uncharacterized protein LOC108199174 [Daucus carota subsp. sativus]WOH13040.1 hypothetical protein DCAR_0832549 [Daucus carota subsp. sativus]